MFADFVVEEASRLESWDTFRQSDEVEESKGVGANKFEIFWMVVRGILASLAGGS